MKKLSLLLALVLLVTCVAGCNPFDLGTNGLSPDGSANDAQNPGGSSDTAAGKFDKYNAYIDLYNYANSGIFSVTDDYFSKVGNGDEPVYEDDFSMSMYQVTEYDLRTVTDALDFVSKQPAYADLDPAADALAGALAPLCKSLQEAKDYYDSKNYVDDGFARGKALHKDIVGQWDAFLTALDAFNPKLDKLAAETKAAELEELKSNGEMISYYASKCLSDMNSLTEILSENDITAETLDTMPLDAYKAAYDTYAADYTELANLANDPDALSGEGYEAEDLKILVDRYKKVKADAATLLEKAQKGEGFSNAELLIVHLTDGTPEKLRESIDSAFYYYNSSFVE